MAIDSNARESSNERLRLLDAIVGLDARINALSSVAGGSAANSQFESLIQQVRDLRKLRAEMQARLVALGEE